MGAGTSIVKQREAIISERELGLEGEFWLQQEWIRGKGKVEEPTRRLSSSPSEKWW